MKILDVIAEDKEWARNPDGSIKQYDDKGNYINGSYLAHRGLNIDMSNADKSVKPTSNAPGSADSSKLATATSDTPKGATEDQMKRFGPSSHAQIDWRIMRQYIASKLSFNHAVAMVVNSKFESQWMPGRWVHSDASQGPSGGLFMFHDADFSGRGFFSDMVAACGGPGKWQTNWQQQIDFALRYPKSAGPAFANMKFSSPEQATNWFCQHFEKPRHYEKVGPSRAKEAHLYTK